MRKLIYLLLFTTFIPSLVSAQGLSQSGAQPVVQSASQNLSTADLLKLLQGLLQQVQALQQQVAKLQGEMSVSQVPAPALAPLPASEVQTQVAAPVALPEVPPPKFTRSLSRGSSGDDVRELQKFLAKDKEVYPDGLVTGYFGPLTEAAVKRWQEKHDVASVGIVGPKTIAKFEELGRGVVQGLMSQGAGRSGVIPPGLLTAPGIQKNSNFPPPRLR